MNAEESLTIIRPWCRCNEAVLLQRSLNCLLSHLCLLVIANSASPPEVTSFIFALIKVALTFENGQQEVRDRKVVVWILIGSVRI